MADQKTKKVENVEPVEVTLSDDKVYITNELTGFQDEAVAELLLELGIDELFAGIDVDDSSDEAALEHAKKLLASKLLSGVAKGVLRKFVGIVLVPKDTPYYRKDIAEKISEMAGDLPNTVIKEVVKSFFGINLSSILNTVSSLSQQVDGVLEVKIDQGTEEIQPTETS